MRLIVCIVAWAVVGKWGVVGFESALVKVGDCIFAANWKVGLVTVANKLSVDHRFFAAAFV